MQQNLREDVCCLFTGRNEGHVNSFVGVLNQLVDESAALWLSSSQVSQTLGVAIFERCNGLRVADFTTEPQPFTTTNIRAVLGQAMPPVSIQTRD